MTVAVRIPDANGSDSPKCRVASLVTPVAVLLCCLDLASCGSSGAAVGSRLPGGVAHGALHAGTSRPPGGGYLASDGDADKDDGGNKGYSLDLAPTGDDFLSANDGGKADRNDARTVVSLIKRYYAAAAAGNGGAACTMLAARLAEGLAEGPPQTNLSPTEACATTISLLFKREHDTFARDDVATMVVVEVQLRDDIATATLGFKTRPIGQIRATKENGEWKMNALIDTESI
jgi:hypothetical protein